MGTPEDVALWDAREAIINDNVAALAEVLARGELRKTAYFRDVCTKVTFLEHAAGFGPPEILEMLIAYGFNVDQRSGHNRKPPLASAHDGKHGPAKVALLRQAGARVDFDGNDSLITAAVMRRDVFEALGITLAELSALAGGLLLFYVRYDKDMTFPREIIECGFPMGNTVHPRTGWTLLHYAASYGIPLCEFFMEYYEADPNAQDDVGKTALQHCRDEDAALYLIGRGATVTGPGDFAEKVMRCACLHIWPNIIALLCSKGHFPSENILVELLWRLSIRDLDTENAVLSAIMHAGVPSESIEAARKKFEATGQQ